jgi:hypothetical protein
MGAAGAAVEKFFIMIKTFLDKVLGLTLAPLITIFSIK